MIEDIHQAIEIEAAPERVWTVLTAEGLVAQWLGCLNYQARIGHVFHMQPNPERREAGDIAGATHCELLRLDAPREMRFSWYFPDTPRTEVSIRLTPTATGTKVELVHSGWDQFDEAAIRAVRDALAGGWSSFVLPGLKRLAEAER